ncbi:MAG: DUF6057 family protein [Tannerella sp.]|jgi:hypothetical protein|nr:DUF6057 family protein [Tannerella sp.]
MKTYRKVSSTIKPHNGTFKDNKPNRYQQVFRIFNTSLTFWILFFLFLFFFLQRYAGYHFHYIEQEHLFLYSKHDLYAKLMRPGGLSQLIADYCTQFFILPYCGALIMSVLFTVTGMLTAGIIRKTAPGSNLFVISIVPVVTLLFVHFDSNYYYGGTVAYCIMSAAFYLYFCITRIQFQLAYALVLSVLLFWVTGPSAFLFVAGIFLWELLTRFTRAYIFMLPLLIITGLSIWSVYDSLVADYRFILLPDGYFNVRLYPGAVIYYSWISFMVILLLAFLLRKRKHIRRERKIAEHICLLVVIALLSFCGIRKYVNFRTAFFEELDYYLRTGQWDQIIERSKGDLKNYLYKFCLNVALAEKGELGEQMFCYDQRGVRGLYLNFNRVSHISTLLSELYFSMGHISLSQRMAFESNVSTIGGNNPRMLKRLVQTNLTYGAYPVAEKYISLLEQTKYYKKWATEHRKFLWNDEAIEQDSLLSIKRKCILPENYLAELAGLDTDLKRIAGHNPSHKASIEYAGAIYLLTKEMAFFKDLVETCYGTEVLPLLPKSFQEAVIILYEQEPAYWEKYHIPKPTIDRYTAYRKQVLANRGNQASLPGLLYRSYGDTYWFYYMFKHTN